MKYSIILTLQIFTAWAVCKENNCTVLPCQTDVARLNRRQWPQLDFDFYHDRPSNSNPNLTLSGSTTPSSTEYSSTHDLSPKPTSSEMRNDSNTHHDNDDEHYNDVNVNERIIKHCQIDPKQNETIQRLDWLKESFLLRSVFQQQSPEVRRKPSRPNISEDFRQKLLRVYRLAIDKQKNSLQNSDKKRRTSSDTNELKRRKRRQSSDVNITVWDIQISKTQPEIDVVYLLMRNNVPIPFEDANKMLSFVDGDVIRNETGYKVLHKILRYDRYREETKTITSGSVAWIWLLVVSIVLLLALISLIIWVVCTRYNRDPIGTLHSEISRLSQNRASRDSRRSARMRDSSHHNLGLETSDSETDGNAPPLPRVPPPPSLHRSDVASQASLEPIYSKPSLLAPISRNFSTLSGRTGSYPVNPNPDYDRISYIKTRETIEEKRKPQNIVEVQMSKETQSIVKEIRNELNRYNMKKILDDAPIGTSKA